MLPGIVIKPLKRFADERGFFTEVMRADWKDVIQDDIVQANMSVSYPGMVRAWHRHERGQVDHFLAVRGALKICAYDDETGELDEIISAGDNPQMVRVPGHYWHGFRVVGNEPATLVYFVNRLYDYEHPDEERRSWNDPTVIPESINGKMDDRCGKSWDWVRPEYKVILSEQIKCPKRLSCIKTSGRQKIHSQVNRSFMMSMHFDFHLMRVSRCHGLTAFRTCSGFEIFAA